MQNTSTDIASQLPGTEWYKLSSNPTVADALLEAVYCTTVIELNWLANR